MNKAESICNCWLEPEDTSITAHYVFPGVKLIYNNIHSGKYPFMDQDFNQNVLIADYCRQGRIEWEFEGGKYFYLGEGDLSLHRHNGKIVNTFFPLEHYHGISLLFNIEKMVPLTPMLQSFNVDVSKIGGQLCGNGGFFVKRKNESLNHIFSEFYRKPDKIREHYFKIKVLELLLLLSVIEGSERDIPTYFKKGDIQKIKIIKTYLTDHLQERITIEEISNMFSFPLTSMKLCFKGVYGLSIDQFMRAYRMQTAAALLRNSGDSIMEIAGRVGYSNASKFSTAFKAEMGMLPLEYRKSV